ncbi:hypothetical protein NBT05_12835 [Aquimarina sp. ERC-38]|uniref:hypothetical protein n=1 Tax=Aquimarina sp. ERC-38 TaxID=2949996 RepID=UPI0022478962|nr:hypothetical protein [Aquimarina sp. ERC-38]UZO79835.1 hypothetical protein NBT05_12835 [Aquimarina sp. ERC-38]
MKKENRKILIAVLIFIGIIPSIIFLIIGIRSLSIFLNFNRYEKGIINIKSFDCGSSHGGDDSNCYGIGTINGLDYRVNLGLAPGNKKIFNIHNHADLSKTNYEVFFIKNKKNAILIKDGQIEFDRFSYLRKSIFELLLPLLIFPLIIYLYKKK